MTKIKLYCTKTVSGFIELTPDDAEWKAAQDYANTYQVSLETAFVTLYQNSSIDIRDHTFQERLKPWYECTAVGNLKSGEDE